MSLDPVLRSAYLHCGTARSSVPIGFYRNRRPNPYSDREGDATFPDFIVLTGVSYRF
ncbi:MAG TPA: hypothetical protein VHC97_12895 [Thermoanaerobaculia bacterium]|jgi:hypothetical protein|nr:hypothetical protein [Thermoanaerobaculia bacterium]